MSLILIDTMTQRSFIQNCMSRIQGHRQGGGEGAAAPQQKKKEKREREGRGRERKKRKKEKRFQSEEKGS